MEQKDNKKPKSLMNNIKNWIKAKAFYNPELRIVSYGKENNCKKVFEYISSKFNDNEEFRRVNNLTVPVVNLPKLKGLYLEKVMGYQKI